MLMKMKNDIMGQLGCDNLLAIFADANEPGSFFAGSVIHLDETSVLLQSYTRYGKFDGFLVIQKEEIYRIETNSKYLNALAKITEDPAIIPPEKTRNNFKEIFKYAKENRFTVSVTLFDLNNDGDITGYVKEINEEEVMLSVLDQYGERDGETVFNICDCCIVSCKSEEGNKLELLSKINSEDRG